MVKRVLIIQGHPAEQSLCEALAKAYEQGAQESGHTVRLLTVRDLKFDPVLHEGYKVIQPLEADLILAQNEIKSADHIVIIFPAWWGGMPALLKGFIDRVFLPGFAFKYHQGSPWWDKLLKGKSAHLIVTMDTPPWYFRVFYRDAGINQMRRTILQYCGVDPVKVTRIGRVKDTTDAWRNAWLSKIKVFGRNA
ncbi:NAD(P)H-dependent oxidoreductase [Pseudothauera nasutitermitis]|uniref:NAD(P)H-dependent oxidoreductase n=1 Tax=Pseudothauera nasutitermitis TaxID=2565930 RepID=A0A4S4B1Z2_9RHOO|nr:NAD(P)H-dependent oxidoreductase [Pseudothauera nasutitermitis]THF66601.1 NAD(P)H-dependent oxidoreductase [Pseudothauera nasutitermitis]